jgi:hypothetical protein
MVGALVPSAVALPIMQLRDKPRIRIAAPSAEPLSVTRTGSDTCGPPRLIVGAWLTQGLGARCRFAGSPCVSRLLVVVGALARHISSHGSARRPLRLSLPLSPRLCTGPGASYRPALMGGPPDSSRG